MRRFALATALSAVFAAFAPAQDKPPEKKAEEKSGDGKNVIIRWRGQSMFEITSKAGTRIVIDPHNIEAYRIKDVKADLVLVTHRHTDHNQLSVITNVKDAKVIQAVKESNTEWNLIEGEKFKDVTVTTVGTYHDKLRGMQRGLNGILVIDVDGLRIVHLGDLGHELEPRHLKKIFGDPVKKVDVVMVPAGAVYTMTGLDAARVVEQIKPTRYAIPMHYGTIVYDYVLDLKKSGFKGEQKPGSMKTYPTNELKIDPADPAPGDPIVAELHWWPTKGAGN